MKSLTFIKIFFLSQVTIVKNICYLGKSNITFMDQVQLWAEKKDIDFNPRKSWIRCGCHSLNLSVVCKNNFILDFLSKIDRLVQKIQDIVVKIRSSRILTE